MFQANCHECGKVIQFQQLHGTLPPDVHLNTYCSEECLTNNVAKNRPSEQQPVRGDVRI